MPRAGITLCQRHGLKSHMYPGTRNKGAPGSEPGFLEAIKSETL